MYRSFASVNLKRTAYIFVIGETNARSRDGTRQRGLATIRFAIAIVAFALPAELHRVYLLVNS
jgi:hypothetical protein